MHKATLKKLSLILLTSIGILVISGCLCPLTSIVNKVRALTPTPTQTITSAPSLTPTITQTPTLTPTPTPQRLDVYYLYDHCSNISQNQETVIVEGRIFLPKFKMISYDYENQTWVGTQLRNFLESETRSLTILIPIGEGPNTLDPIPIPFNEKDLIIRDDNNHIIRHYQSVLIKGRVEYFKNEDGSRCQIWMESIQTRASEEIQIPQEVSIFFLNQKKNMGTKKKPQMTTNCELLAQKHQMVTISGSIISLGTNQCNNVSCTFQFSDNTGSISISLANREGPNSVFKPKGELWQIYDKANNPISLYSLKLTGVLYLLSDGCRMSVYEIESR